MAQRLEVPVLGEVHLLVEEAAFVVNVCQLLGAVHDFCQHCQGGEVFETQPT